MRANRSTRKALLFAVVVSFVGLEARGQTEPAAPPKASVSKVKKSKAKAKAAPTAPAAKASSAPAPAADQKVEAAAPATTQSAQPAPAPVAAAAPAAAASDPATEQLWKSKCGSCHGADGKARTAMGKKMKMDDMTSAAWQSSRTDEQMRTAILEGAKAEKDGVKQTMPAFKEKLQPGQVDALVKQVRSLSGK